MVNINRIQPCTKNTHGRQAYKGWPITRARAHVNHEDEAAQGSLPALSSSSGGKGYYFFKCTPFVAQAGLDVFLQPSS